MWGQLTNTVRTLERKFGTVAGEPRTFSWMGEDFPCVAGTLRAGSEVVPGGFEDSAPITFTVRAELFDDAVTVDSTEITVDSTAITADSDLRVPRTGDVIEFEFAQYRIITVGKVLSHYRFVCESVDRV